MAFARQLKALDDVFTTDKWFVAILSNNVFSSKAVLSEDIISALAALSGVLLSECDKLLLVIANSLLDVLTLLD